VDELEPIKKQRLGPILWRERYIIIASIVVMVGLAIAYTVTSSKVYQATGLIQVNIPTAATGTSDTTNANQALAQNYATLLASPGFLRSIQPTVDNGNLSVDELESRVSASALPNSALVQLHANGASTTEAQRIAQQVIAGFLASLRTSAKARTAQLTGQLNQEIAALNAQIAHLQSSSSTSTSGEQITALKAQRTALIAQQSSMAASGLAQGASATEAAAPQASSTPVSPKKTLNLLAGLLLGVLLGVALAWARQRLRPAIHSARDVSALVDLPVLASIPLKSRLKADDPALPEAYGVLHANLMFALRTGDMRIVTAVGFNPGVGKTSTVEGTARAASRGDRQVLVIDGDMRAATLSARFNQRDHPGLVDVLQGAIPLDSALVQVEHGLWLMPTRQAKVNPAGLLAGSRTFALLADLRERFDLVLIDSPPLSGLADGLILSSLSDAVVLVVRAGITKPADLTAATSSLLHNMTPIAGTVVFEELPEDTSYYYAPPDEQSKPSAARVN
jgi:capsular exopolysaccharide synthesis family protein